MNRPTRRHLMTTAGALPLVGLAAVVPAVALAAAHPDATLIGLCDHLVFLEHAWRTQGDAVTDPSDEALAAVVEPLWDEREVVLARLEPMTARTNDGVAALMRVVAAANPFYPHGSREHSFDGGFIGRLLDMALRDAVALGPVPAMVATGTVAHPDAVLIAEGERFLEASRQITAAYAACGSGTATDHASMHTAEETTDRAVEPLEAELEAILERMRGLHARTLDGHRMRAQVLFAYSPEIKRNGDPEAYKNGQLAWLLVRDLVGGELV